MEVRAAGKDNGNIPQTTGFKASSMYSVRHPRNHVDALPFRWHWLCPLQLFHSLLEFRNEKIKLQSVDFADVIGFY